MVISDWISLSIAKMQYCGLCSKDYYCLLYFFAVPVILYLAFGRKKVLSAVRRDGGFKNINWSQLEVLAKEYYKEKGYRVKRQGGAQADGGIDLIAKKGSVSALVQVKHYSKPVGVKIVREMLGVLMDNRGQFNEVHIVTSARFTKQAMELASRHSVTLINGAQLLKK